MVWDWNGTLLADTELLVASLNTGLLQLGAATLTVTQFRATFRPPLMAALRHFAGHRISSAEWNTFSDAALTHYQAGLDTTPLAADAVTALAMLRDAGVSQSLLSMWPAPLLRSAATGKGLDDWFIRTDGNTQSGQETKTHALRHHLHACAVDPATTALIGDDLDDAAAARAVGARSIRATANANGRQLEPDGDRTVSTVLQAVQRLLAD